MSLIDYSQYFSISGSILIQGGTLPDQYNSDKATIGELLSLTSPNTIEVPDWQRSYSWTEKHVETFWQDLLAFSARYPGETINRQEYFLGSVVLVNSERKRDLLDGQQRLATATILLSVIAEYLDRYSKDAATRTCQKYICEVDDATSSKVFKLRLNYYDREFFRQSIQTFPRTSPPTADHDSHQLILKAREFFRKQFEDKYTELSGGKPAYDWALRIRKVLTDHMSVVAVSSLDEDNASSVFETLNDRGIGLSTPDLLRNLLLRRAEGGDREEIIRCWNIVLSLDRRVEIFLRHYWLSRRGDVKTQSLYREIKSAVMAEDIGSLEFSRELRDEAKLYMEIISGNDDDSITQRYLEDIRLLGANVLYPSILSAYAKYTEEERPKFFSRLIAYFVRHNVIGNLENSLLEGTVFSIAQKIRAGTDMATILQEIKTKAVTDDEFERRFAVTSQKRTNSARYLLTKLEVKAQGTDELQVELPDRVHVEHIYPQEPEAGQKLLNHELVINRLGNLTLLAKKLNLAAQNETFAKKKPFYEQSKILITRELLQSSDWNMEAIETRQKRMARLAPEIWPV